MTDLELLHNYATSTCLTFAEHSVGLNCSYIMRAILGVSALHIAHHRQGVRDKYEAIAIAYHQAAAREAMPLIATATPESAQMLFLFSVVTAFYALGWPRKSAGNLLFENPGFPDWVYLLRGTKGFIDLAGVPETGPLAPLFLHSVSRFQLREGPEAADSTAHETLNELGEIIARRPLDPRTKQIYAFALEELKKSFSQAQSCRGDYLMTDTFIWLYQVAEDFLPLLRSSAKEAVAIFAFFCVLLKKLDGHWWMQGWGGQLIGQAHEMLDEEGRIWIHWAVHEAGYVPPLAIERL